LTLEFSPYPTRLGWHLFAYGIGILISLFFAMILFNPITSEGWTQLGLIVFSAVCLLMAGILLYWGISIVKVKYYLNRNGLLISWGGWQFSLPIADILDIQKPPAINPPSIKGFHYWHVLIGSSQETGKVPQYFVSTTAPEDCLQLVTASSKFLISPAEPERFISEWQRRKALGTTQKWSQEWKAQWNWLRHPFWYDRVAWVLIAAAVLTSLCFFVYVLSVLPSAPPFLPIHFDAFGRADRIVPKEDLLRLPLIGLTVCGLNSLAGILFHSREKMLSYLFWAGAIIVQIMLLLAIQSILG
jgi:hypothetical protein